MKKKSINQLSFNNTENKSLKNNNKLRLRIFYVCNYNITRRS